MATSDHYAFGDRQCPLPVHMLTWLFLGTRILFTAYFKQKGANGEILAQKVDNVKGKTSTTQTNCSLSLKKIKKNKNPKHMI